MGYKLAGFDVKASVEFVDFQAENYRRNFPDAKVFEADIRSLDPRDICSFDLDVLDGSPPCSSFSACGSREDGWGKSHKYSNTEQRTDDLFNEYLRFVNVLRPKVAVAENVKGLTMGKARGVLYEILKSFEAMGYRVKARILEAQHYGVPQIRPRLFFVAVRGDLNLLPVFPVPENKKVTVGDAIRDCKPIPEELLYASIERYAISKEAVKLRPGESSARYFNLIKADPRRPSFTLTATASNSGSASVIHWNNRKFTATECKRIATLPDDFILTGTLAQQIEACGRCVPPQLMKRIAEAIKPIVDK